MANLPQPYQYTLEEIDGIINEEYTLDLSQEIGPRDLGALERFFNWMRKREDLYNLTIPEVSEDAAPMSFEDLVEEGDEDDEEAED